MTMTIICHMPVTTGRAFYFPLNVVCSLKQNVKAFLMPIGKKNKGNLRIKAGNPPGTGKQDIHGCNSRYTLKTPLTEC